MVRQLQIALKFVFILLVLTVLWVSAYILMHGTYGGNEPVVRWLPFSSRHMIPLCAVLFGCMGFWLAVGLVKRIPPAIAVLPAVILGFAAYILSLEVPGFPALIPVFYVIPLLLYALTFSLILALPLMLLFSFVFISATVIGTSIVLTTTYCLLVLLIGICRIIASRLFAEWKQQFSMFNQAQKSVEELARINAQLQDTMSFKEITSRSMERIRIAREVHDTVGYSLTAVLMQISAAKRLYSYKPASVPERLSSMETFVRNAIQEVRREVRSLRGCAEALENWVNRCANLCEVFAQSTGVSISTHFSDELKMIDSEIGDIIYRVIQEALTNAYRHGKATVVDLAMGLHDNSILLRISDNGQGAAHPAEGCGLKGIRERISSLGGEYMWETAPGKGFDIGIEIPLSKGYEADTAENDNAPAAERAANG